jgi:hypothetical protein
MVRRLEYQVSGQPFGAPTKDAEQTVVMLAHAQNCSCSALGWSSCTHNSIRSGWSGVETRASSTSPSTRSALEEAPKAVSPSCLSQPSPRHADRHGMSDISTASVVWARW